MITVFVSYQLQEYLSVCLEFAPYAVAAKKAKKPLHSIPGPLPPVSFFAKTSIIAFASLAFFYKVATVGDCTFEFTSSGITRKSKLGISEVPWAEVLRAYRFTQAYMFAKVSGAMPVPLRCFSPEQMSQLHALLSSNELASKSAA